MDPGASSTRDSAQRDAWRGGATLLRAVGVLRAAGAGGNLADQNIKIQGLTPAISYLVFV